MTKKSKSFSISTVLALLLLLTRVSYAEEKLCSTQVTQETVIRLFEQGFYKDAMAAFVLDRGQTSMQLEAVRTAEQTPSRFVCRASVSMNLTYKPGYEKVRQFANPVKSEVGYTVEITDDGQQYVTLSK